jgi:hypothetical protein
MNRTSERDSVGQSPLWGVELAALLARVEAATGPDHGIDRACWALFEAIPPANPLSLAYVTARDFSGSLDAALALVERVRPGWCALLAISPDNTRCNLLTKPLGTVGVWHPLATAPTAPLALLAALLLSLVAETKATVRYRRMSPSCTAI